MQARSNLSVTSGVLILLLCLLIPLNGPAHTQQGGFALFDFTAPGPALSWLSEAPLMQVGAASPAQAIPRGWDHGWNQLLGFSAAEYRSAGLDTLTLEQDDHLLRSIYQHRPNLLCGKVYARDQQDQFKYVKVLLDINGKHAKDLEARLRTDLGQVSDLQFVDSEAEADLILSILDNRARIFGENKGSEAAVNLWLPCVYLPLPGSAQTPSSFRLLVSMQCMIRPNEKEVADAITREFDRTVMASTRALHTQWLKLYSTGAGVALPKVLGLGTLPTTQASSGPSPELFVPAKGTPEVWQPAWEQRLGITSDDFQKDGLASLKPSQLERLYNLVSLNLPTLSCEHVSLPQLPPESQLLKVHFQSLKPETLGLTGRIAQKFSGISDLKIVKSPDEADVLIDIVGSSWSTTSSINGMPILTISDVGYTVSIASLQQCTYTEPVGAHSGKRQVTKVLSTYVGTQEKGGKMEDTIVRQLNQTLDIVRKERASAASAASRPGATGKP